jgi:hypothetical protein
LGVFALVVAPYPVHSQSDSLVFLVAAGMFTFGLAAIIVSVLQHGGHRTQGED